MSKFKMLPLVLGITLASQGAHAADLISIAHDALENNASLLGDEAALEATRAGQDVARAPLLPQVNAVGQVSRNHISNAETPPTDPALDEYLPDQGAANGNDNRTYNESSISVQATQAIFDASNWYQLEASKRQVAQETLNFANNRQTLLYDVANAYFETLRAKEVLDTLRTAEATYEQQLEQTQQQYDVGVVAATELREAEASYDAARAQRISQQSILQVNFNSLEQLTGKQYPSIDRLSEDLPIETPVPANRQAWIEMGNSQNLALQTARAGIDTSRAELAIARAGYLPTLNAFANWNYGGSNRYDGFNKTHEFGLQANIPLYTGGATTAQVRQNTHLLEQSQFSAEEQMRFTIQQISSSYAQTTNDVHTVGAQERAVESSRTALQATEDGYEAGTRTILDVLDAQNNYYTSLQNYASSRYDYVLNMLSLRQNAGVLDVSTLEELNNWLVEDDSPVRIDGGGNPLQTVGNADIDPSSLGS